jgi:hypothetical protein
MARELRAMDIDDAPELARVAEEVRHTNEPRVLRLRGEDVAILRPVKRPNKRRKTREKAEADYEAFRSAAGGWHDVDTDKLIADIYASRSISGRPPVEL